jgi:Ni2+-binding GTPase involved in maturation of urease and hydrogenase
LRKAKNDKETPIIKKVVVLGGIGSGKTAIFARALKIEET